MRSYSKLDPFADNLAGWLKTEARKSRKQRRSLKRMHADLVALGFTGSYNRVAAFAREWRADPPAFPIGSRWIRSVPRLPRTGFRGSTRSSDARCSSELQIGISQRPGSETS